MLTMLVFYDISRDGGVNIITIKFINIYSIVLYKISSFEVIQHNIFVVGLICNIFYLNYVIRHVANVTCPT